MKNIYPELKPPSATIANERRRQKMNKFNKFNTNIGLRKLPGIVNRFQIQLSGTNFCVESEESATTKGSKLILQKCLAIKRQVCSGFKDY